MAKLGKVKEKLHEQACELVDLKRDLTEDERQFVLHHWHESSTARNGLDGAFFTPLGLAGCLAIHVGGNRILDLGAGIGRLSYACGTPREIICVEKNAEYVRVGRKVLPEATWICGDILDVPTMNLGRFDTVIGNPPFGVINRARNASRYTGPRFEYHAIAVASQMGNYGAFIVPQQSAPFRLSGIPFFEDNGGDHVYKRFQRETGITLEPNCGIDTAYYADEWRGVRPHVEVVICDFIDGLDSTCDVMFNM